MFCSHVLDYDPGDLVRDALGRVLCPECTAICEQCARAWFRDAMSEDGLCTDCAGRNAAAGNVENRRFQKRGNVCK